MPRSSSPASRRAGSAPEKEAKLNDQGVPMTRETQHDDDDFYRSFTDEPHTTRRREMLAKYPQIKELYGPDPTTALYVFLWVSAQFLLTFYVVPHASWVYVLVLTYCFGAFAAHALFLAMHELSHNLAFKKPALNRVCGIFANLATVFPHFSMFQRYHMEHHQYQGVEGVDVDVPSKLEGEIFTSIPMKFLWISMLPLEYVFRPLFVSPKSPGFWEVINWTACIGTGVAVWWFHGEKAIAYLLLSGLIGSGFHPIAGHFIAEHFVTHGDQETYSYYGPLNFLTFHVGYHNEHHDFPRIPGTRLHAVRAIAPEYYENLHSYSSWWNVIMQFLLDPKLTPFSRVVRKRKAKGTLVADPQDIIESLGS